MAMLSRLRSSFVAQKVVKPLRRAWVALWWWLFDRVVFPALLKRTKRPESAGSVLHVSCLSHKPFMLSRLMRKHGLKSEYMAIAGETGWLKFGDKGWDYNLPGFPWTLILQPFDSIYALAVIMRRYDIIHYHFASIITPDGRELDYLRRMGKRIVFHFRGCDLRQKSANNTMNPDLNCCQECDYPEGACDHDIQKQRIALAREHADILWVTTPDLQDFMPEAEHLPFIAPFGLDAEAIVPAKRTPGIFRVVTSSNHHGVDGTQYVRDAVKRLQDEGRAIELVEVHKTPYEEALGIYKSADVYLGKLRMGYYNNANIECMMLGVPCMSYIREEYMDNIPDCPIIPTRPETAYEILKEWMDKPEDLAERGSMGPAFIEKYHSPNALAKQMITRYTQSLDI